MPVKVIDLEVNITCRETKEKFEGKLIGQDLFCPRLAGKLSNAIERCIAQQAKGSGVVPYNGKHYNFRVIFP